MAKKQLIKKPPVQVFLESQFEPTTHAASSSTTHEPAKEPAAAGPAPEQICGLKVHPAANEFPMLCGTELAELTESVRSLGQTTPVVVDGDTLLEGRNRALAVEILKQEGHDIGLKSIQWESTPECPTPSAYIGAVNLCRRHLTDDQRAMIAARLVPHIEREQAERQTLSRIKVGEQRNPTGRNQHSKPKAGDASPAPGTKPCPPSTEGTNKGKRENSTRGKIAKQAGVSHHKADLAVRVTKAATKPEIEAVIAGKKKLAAVDREIKERLGEKRSSPAGKKARKPVEHPFKPADDFELDCLLAWTGLIEKKLGVTAKVRARGVFLEIFAAEEKSERGGTQSGEVNAPSKNLPVATSAPAAQDADDFSPDFDEPEPPVAKSDAKPAPKVKPKAAAKKNGAAELIHPANLWGKPLPSRFGGSGT